jgi:hypothetical protein
VRDIVEPSQPHFISGTLQPPALHDSHNTKWSTRWGILCQHSTACPRDADNKEWMDRQIGMLWGFKHHYRNWSVTFHLKDADYVQCSHHVKDSNTLCSIT